MIIFAVQDGGQCHADDKLDGYQKYGGVTRCKNKKGGIWAMDVYRITNPIKPSISKGLTFNTLNTYQIFIVR